MTFADLEFWAMRQRQKTKASPKDRLIAIGVIAGLLVVFVIAMVLSTIPKGSSNSGPKLIQADGNTYYACGGAV
jgi:hypothetical protein